MIAIPHTLLSVAPAMAGLPDFQLLAVIALVLMVMAAVACIGAVCLIICLAAIVECVIHRSTRRRTTHHVIRIRSFASWVLLVVSPVLLLFSWFCIESSLEPGFFRIMLTVSLISSVLAPIGIFCSRRLRRLYDLSQADVKP